MNHQESISRSKQRRVLLLFLLTVGVLAVISSVTNPLFEPPDELQHYQFVRSLLTRKQLPVQELDGNISQFHQPPLYYLGGALLVAAIEDPETLPERNPFWAYFAAGEVDRDNKNQFLNPLSQAFPYEGTALVVHGLRLWSLLLALGTVVGVWLVGTTIWPARPTMVAALLALAVLNPMFLYVSGAVNNDSLVILCGAFILWFTLRAMSDGFSWPTITFIGLIWSLALLAKVTGLMLAAVWGTALILVSWQTRDWRLFFSRLGVIIGIVFLVAGWWFIRNIELYGEPFALERQLAVWGSRIQFNWSHLIPDLSYAWTTFWGRFGYGQVPMPQIIYWALFFGTLVALMGLIIGYRRSTDLTPWRTWERRVILVLGIATLVYIASIIYYIFRSPTGANGRYVFPILPAFAVLLVLGLTSWIKRIASQRLLHIGIVIFMMVLALYSIGFLLPRTYAQPRLIDESEVQKQFDNPQQVIWNEQVELLGVSFDSTDINQGQSVTVTTCWTTGDAIDEDYTMAIHLLDNAFQSYGQRDSYHGQGKFPTSFWQPGDIFCDSYEIEVLREIENPLVADVSLTLYIYGSGEKLMAETGVGNVIDIVPVGQVKLMPSEGPAVADDEVTSLAAFEQGLSLVDFQWNAVDVSPGQDVTVTIKWHASEPLHENYTVFAHLLDASGQLVAQSDGIPRNGAYPTNFWGENEIISDSRTFVIPADVDPGSLTLNTGLYILENNSRLPRAAGSDLPDSVILPGPTVKDQ